MSSNVTPAPSSSASPAIISTVGVLRLHDAGRWFQVDSGSLVDLSRHRSLRLMLVVLARRRLARVGSGIDVASLFREGWSGEVISSFSAAQRVYTSIRLLRRKGLDGILVRHDDGYLIDPSVRMEFCESSVRYQGMASGR